MLNCVNYFAQSVNVFTFAIEEPRKYLIFTKSHSSTKITNLHPQRLISTPTSMRFFTFATVTACLLININLLAQTKLPEACKASPFKDIIKPDKPITGKKKALILLVDFQDVKMQPAHDRNFFDKICNRPGLNEPPYVGSVHDYFLDASRGQFDLSFDVVGPITMPNKLAYYGQNNPYLTDRKDIHCGEMIAQACTMADSQVDFKNYDWDDDGEIEMVFVIYAGHGENNSSDTNTIWPKQFNLLQSDFQNTLTLDGVKINTFACSCELNGEKGYEPTGIAAICHEFSHCFGLPDLYDPYGNFPTLGYWDLMDMGMYNQQGYCPAGYSAYERWYSGWLEPIELTEECEVLNLKPLSQGGEAYVIYNDANRNEFLMLENRQLSGWDSALPDHGLLITRINYDPQVWASNGVNSDYSHHCIKIFAADNDLEDNAGDTFRLPFNGEFSDTSYPSARTFFANTDGEKKFHKPIYDIRENSDGTVSFSFMKRSGIDELTADELAQIRDIFTLSGVRLSSLPEKGIVIVRLADGRVCKIAR